MSAQIITTEDLKEFKTELLEEIRTIITRSTSLTQHITRYVANTPHQRNTPLHQNRWHQLLQPHRHRKTPIKEK